MGIILDILFILMIGILYYPRSWLILGIINGITISYEDWNLQIFPSLDPSDPSDGESR